MTISIEVQHLSKEYDERLVVNDVSFKVMKGEVFGLLGHNGAGKSTTINCILGLTKPNQGSAKILGQSALKRRRSLFQKVGVQLQQSHFQNNIKVYEICEETAILYAHPLDYKHLLQQFQLSELMNHKVEDLSGGERQKLSVVIALIGNPEVIFLDELTTGLDVAARREVWQILKTLKEQGITIFLTTHYMEEAENLCDRILILKAGKQVIAGSVNEIIEQSPYKNLEEAYLWYTGEESLV